MFLFDFFKELTRIITSPIKEVRDNIGALIDKIDDVLKQPIKTIADGISQHGTIFDRIFSEPIKGIHGALASWTENAEKIIKTPLDMLGDKIVDLKDALEDRIRQALIDFLKINEADLAATYKDVFPSVMLNAPYIKDILEQGEKKVGQSPAFLGGLGAAIIGGAVGAGFGMGMSGFGRDIQNYFNVLRPVNPLPPEVAWWGFHTGLIDKPEEYVLYIRQHGYDEKAQRILENYFATKPSLTEVTEWYHHGIIDYNTYIKRLKELGYTEQDAEIIENVSWHYPSVSDFITFAVREVFKPDKVEKYQLDAEFPSDIVEHAKKAGIKQEQLMWYWRAHWDLPSPTQVYEMLHRLSPEYVETHKDKFKEMGIDPEKIKTDLTTVREYLGMADITPYWRDRLVAISYLPLTRVDVRRMYQLGVIDAEEVYWCYRELGYDDLNARRLTEFVIADTAKEERDLTKAEILRLYEEGMISEEYAKQKLIDMGYSTEEAEFLIALRNLKITNEQRKEEAYAVIRQAAEQGWEEAQVRHELETLGLTLRAVDEYVRKWKRMLKERAKMPSVGDLRRWYKYGIINDAEFLRRLINMGYTEDDANNYLKAEQRAIEMGGE